MNCGSLKKRALTECGNCHFVPSSPEEQAQSLILSKAFDADEHIIGLSQKELKEASELLSSGGKYHFTREEVSNVISLHERAKAITAKVLIIDLVKWLGPPLCFLGLLLWMAWK